jgi:hypothetical protein
VINASDLLGAPQIAGIVVSPIGLFRRLEASQTAFVGGVVVPGKLGAMIGDKLGGKSAAQQRQQDTAVSHSTPNCGNWGYLAVTDTELALTTTEAGKWGAGRRLGQLVKRVPRSTVAHVELAGGWQHPTLYMFSSAPLRITFTDGTAWAFEVNRFARHRTKHLARTLQSR